MDIHPLTANDLPLNLPLEYVKESLYRYGLTSCVQKTCLDAYKTQEPLFPILLQALWDCRKHPHLTTWALLMAPLINKHHPVDLVQDPLWPSVADVIGGTFPMYLPDHPPTNPRATKAALHTTAVQKNQNVDIPWSEHMLFTLLSSDVSAPMGEAVLKAVSFWTPADWNRIFSHEKLPTWLNAPVNDWGNVCKNLRSLSSLTPLWTQLACAAVAHDRPDLLRVIMDTYAQPIQTHIRNHPDHVLTPQWHLFNRSVEENVKPFYPNLYKIARVCLWVQSLHGALEWGDNHSVLAFAYFVKNAISGYQSAQRGVPICSRAVEGCPPHLIEVALKKMMEYRDAHYMWSAIEYVCQQNTVEMLDEFLLNPATEEAHPQEFPTAFARQQGLRTRQVLHNAVHFPSPCARERKL